MSFIKRSIWLEIGFQFQLSHFLFGRWGKNLIFHGLILLIFKMREMPHHMMPIGNHGEETKSVTELNERDREREREREFIAIFYEEMK